MSEKQLIDISTAELREEAAAKAMKSKATVKELVEILEGPSRTCRQRAAATLALVAAQKPSLLKDYSSQIAGGVERPEDQTRWECLNALCFLIADGQVPDEDVLPFAEDALFDEDNGIVREAAFRFMCAYGSLDPAKSDAVWSDLDEAIQCYHGNGEFSDMLTALLDFAASNISAQTAEALSKRMAFDAENARGTLRMRATQIVEACGAHTS